MTYPSPPNPYASPTATSAVPPASPTFKPIDKIEHLRMYRFVFDNPNWLINILLTALCLLIPVIGGLVALGYQFEVVATLLLTQGARYPDFSFDRFVDYLVRGLWPFLVQLVASLVIMPIFFVVLFLPMMLIFGIGAGAGEDAAPVIYVLGFTVLGLFSIVVSVVLSMVLLPLMLRAGLAQDFVEGFNLGWAMDFLKKTCKETFIALLFLVFSAAVLSILGIVACYIGLFLVMPVIFLAQAHLYYQLYLLHLSRGGAPVPQKAGTYGPPI